MNKKEAKALKPTGKFVEINGKVLEVRLAHHRNGEKTNLVFDSRQRGQGKCDGFYILHPYEHTLPVIYTNARVAGRQKVTVIEWVINS